MKLHGKKLHFVVFIIIIFFFVYKIGEIPTGLFCDEAEIGNIAFQLSTGNISPYFITPFFYRHFHYILGSLPVILTAPFIFFLERNELSVRLSSVFYALLGLFFYLLTLRELNAKKIYPLLLLAFTPLFFHISRINFGHTPSFLFISLALFFLVKYRKTEKLIYLMTSALSFGISSYGYGGYMLGTPILILSLLLGELIHNKFNIHKYKGVIILSIIFVVTYLPILYQLKYNPDFSQRLKDKNEGKVVNLVQKIPGFIRNYPKYYSYDYLFSKGEIELPGSFITRHSIKGNGIYLKIYLAILILGFLNLFFVKDKQKHYFTPFFILFLLSPIPDLITTKDSAPPYSFSMFYSLISVPFITAYALKIIGYLPKKQCFKKGVILINIVTAVILIIEIVSFLNNYYYKYPSYSSDYWGWQYGPKEIIKYFITEKDNYDELYMTGYFNEPLSLLSFYNYDNKCKNCFVGGTEMVDPNKKQLFAVRKEEINNLKIDYYAVKKIIYLPNNEEAYYIIEPKKLR
jgi:4-amino-4-deoxy-L-arabinose transferase-like glycosyltransferase